MAFRPLGLLPTPSDTARFTIPCGLQRFTLFWVLTLATAVLLQLLVETVDRYSSQYTLFSKHHAVRLRLPCSTFCQQDSLGYTEEPGQGHVVSTVLIWGPYSAAFPLSVKIPVPQKGSIVGKGGLGWNLEVDLISVEGNRSILSAVNNYTLGYNAPGTASFRPGRSSYAPGLVVLCNGTETGGLFYGPNTNLAGLFQINAIGSTVSFNTYASLRYGWQVGAAAFGVGVATTCSAFVVDGAASDVYFASNLTAVISDVAAVEFMIGEESVEEGKVNTWRNASAAGASNSPVYTSSIISPSEGDATGASGLDWVVDLIVNSNSSGAFTMNNATLPLLSSPNSTTFKVGPSAALPGLVVLLNSSSNSAPFMGPMTNLAGLFQINAITGHSAATGMVTQVQMMWQVGKAFTTSNVTSFLSVFMVAGTAPLLVNSADIALPGSQSNLTFKVV